MREPGEIDRIGSENAEDETTRLSASASLSSDLLAAGRRRLGWLALLTAGAVLVLHFVYRILFPDDLSAQSWITKAVLLGSVAVFFLSSLAMWRVSLWKALADETVLHLGIAYMVLCAWLITLLNTSPKLGTGEVGPYGFADSWIVVVALTLPVKPWKIGVACVLCVLALPVCIVANQQLWNARFPPPQLVTISMISTVVVGAIAVFLASLNYRLRVELTEARKLGAYHLLRRIGRGGMGEVWLAKHSLLASAAAVKLIRKGGVSASTSSSEASLMRFEREAKATAGLRSPHTVAVYDFGTTGDGQLYYAMEFLEGLDFKDLVKRFGPLPAGRAINLLMQACDSLREAHRHGIVHRDIKPSNLFLCRLGDNYDFVKVLDFGLAKEISGSGKSIHLTQEGATTGTPAYMAPEIALGSSKAEATTDLYSLGCVAYWLVSGVDVFGGQSPMAVLVAHAKEEPVAPSKRTENPVAEDLERVILWCLEKDPSKRPQTAGELLRALQALSAAGEWSNEDAERWWKLHLPDVKGMALSADAEHAPTVLVDRAKRR